MTPGKYNMVCPQGSTFSESLSYSINAVPVDLTGYTAKMQVRESHASKTAKITLTTENDGIVLGGESGDITVTITAQASSSLAPKQYVYDLELVSPSSLVQRLIEGKFIVTPEVTR